MNIRQYFYLLMKDKRNDLFYLILKGPLLILSFIYAAAIKLVDFAYKFKFRKKHKVPGAIVISVGNITLGGTGKTPFSLFLADSLNGNGKNCAILTRGYGNDESRMLKAECPSMPVFTGQDRVKQASLAVESGSKVLILDDGFQHRRIQRDYDILLLDSSNLFGNGCLIPRGILREPVSSIKRADIFVLTKSDLIDNSRKEDIKNLLNKISPGIPIISTEHKSSSLTDSTGAVYSTDTLNDKNVFLFSAIGDPDYFSHLVEDEGAKVVLRHDYMDHYAYGQSDIVFIHLKSCKEKPDMIITTKKDWVKLRDLDISSIKDKLFILNISVAIVDGKEELFAGLDRVINS